MDPILTSALTSFVTSVATNSSKAPMQTLDDLWYLAFGKINHIAEKKRARNQFDLDAYKNSIAQKILTIEEDNLQEPPMSVVGPALEASKYYIEEETLREMFANIIAASMDKSKSKTVHHSFVEITKQLSPEDARNLVLFKDTDNYPIVQFIFYLPNRDGYNIWKSNVFHGNLTNIRTGEENATSITNLSRLGLVSISYDESYINKNKYAIYRESDLFKTLQNQPNSNATFDLKEGIVRISPLGKTFINICL
ncbi:DUF4393 domain-containing protein [Heyndrickxia camelliae]|uniref:DUF4393 domain-containing protein n=1 Tax=Heyndrickxia camelliae TaxID=1707093 RepID=A0A2N3LK10_9BACI|nr:DUF4393 domain-containing protein [Heyndrickxia camelliae]PKR84879.1 hypothetical protein CWO92_10920 [Heyndrickxia camelliae]